jgi:tRNA U34 5-carboxymethylaminomethyl modifying GTPase MnmE/TrmE
VLDGSRPFEKEDLSLIEELSQACVPVVVIVNKSDLDIKADLSILDGKFDYILNMSAKDGNADELSSIVEKLFTDEKISVGEDAIVSGARQYASLCRAKEFLLSSLNALSSGLPSDVYSSDVELAVSALSELDGRSVSEDVVAGIFSHFCVGK